MPDNKRLTVSASQVAALYEKSPYLTKWMLFQSFANAMPIDSEPNERMEIGTLLEDDILELTRRRLRLDVTPNRDYVRHASLPLGCTTDATITDPSLGAGVVDAKSVDWLVWKQSWTEEFAPPHIELQIQAQMLVLAAKWGVIAALVGGNELRLYKRLPNQEVHESLAAEAVAFFQQVKDGIAPPPIGEPIEIPGLKFLYPQTTAGVIITDLSQATDALVLAYRDGGENEKMYGEQRESAKVKLLALAKDSEILNTLTHSVYVKRAKNGAVRLNIKENESGN